MAEPLPYTPPTPHSANTLPADRLLDGATSITESGWPHDGYPELEVGGVHGRLFMTAEEVRARTGTEEAYLRSDGTATKIYRILLPPGHDTESVSRQDFLADPINVSHLIYPPIPDITTGSGARVRDFDPGAFQRYLDMGYTVFDAEDRPLPGSYERVIQLLALRRKGVTGDPVGMPVGNGTFASPGYHPAADAFPIMSMSPSDHNELAVLAYGRPATRQSVTVWAPPGGFGNKLDIPRIHYSSWQTAVRLCLAKADFDISGFTHAETHDEFALSSPTTANAGLVAKSHLVVVPYSQEIAERVHHEVPENTTGAQWLSVSALIARNSELRHQAFLARQRKEDAPNQIVWSTHMRGLIASINKYRQLRGRVGAW